MIHSGAVIAAGISQGRSTSLKRDFRVSSFAPPPRSGCGVGAARSGLKMPAFRGGAWELHWAGEARRVLPAHKLLTLSACRSLSISGGTRRSGILSRLELPPVSQLPLGPLLVKHFPSPSLSLSLAKTGMPRKRRAGQSEGHRGPALGNGCLLNCAPSPP